MTTSLPSDSALRVFIRRFVRDNADSNDGVVNTSVRKIRSAVSEHFDVEEQALKEGKMGLIKEAAQEYADEVGREATENVEKEEEGSSSRGADHEEEEEKEEEEAEEAEDEFSSLEDEGPVAGPSRAKPSKPDRDVSKTSRKSKKERKSSTTAAKGDKDEEELTRLKKFVTACGVRKVWSKWYSTVSPPAETTKAQIKAVRDLLTELGMEGRLSMEKAKAIREKREFEEEMRAIGADRPVAPDTDDARSSRSKPARRTGARKSLAESEDEDGDAGSEESEEAAAPAAKKPRFNASLAAFAAELNSDEDDD